MLARRKNRGIPATMKIRDEGTPGLKNTIFF
jgi:hypothetical protein